MKKHDMDFRGKCIGDNDGKLKEPLYIYDPKFDVKIVFEEDLRRTEVIAWLLRNGIHKHSLNGVIYLRKKEYEV